MTGARERDLRGIVRARELSEATVANMKQNLGFALAYNSLGVPIAAGVLYPFFGILLSPVIAALAMSFSSVPVVTNPLQDRPGLKIESHSSPDAAKDMETLKAVARERKLTSVARFELSPSTPTFASMAVSPAKNAEPTENNSQGWMVVIPDSRTAKKGKGQGRSTNASPSREEL